MKENINIQIYSEENLDKYTLENMHYLYEQHCLKWGIWGSKYLTKDFFHKSLENKENLLIFSAFRESTSKPIAMSMCVRSKENLWGRYWGSIDNINDLHFELCYYQPIEWAIKNNIKKFDPGAGGKHKRRRGFYAKRANSFHKWFNNEMEMIISDWLKISNLQTIEEIELENKTIPFCK